MKLTFLSLLLGSTLVLGSCYVLSPDQLDNIDIIEQSNTLDEEVNEMENELEAIE